MSDPSDLVEVDGRGGVRVIGEAARERLGRCAGRFRLAAETPGLIILRADLGEEETMAMRVAEGEPRVLMSGEIVSRTTMLEILNMIAHSGWKGELSVYGDGQSRKLFFDQGALRHASSTHPEDRFGEVLYKSGALTSEELESSLAALSSTRRLGQIVLERGFLTQEELFALLRRQAEQIFFSSLVLVEGSFVFRLPDQSASPPAHTVHVPIQSLLMQGVQRIDEMALFREKIPNDDMVPTVLLGTTLPPLEPEEKAILARADGEMSIEEIARETGLGTFRTVKLLYHLVQHGVVELTQRDRFDELRVASLVEDFNAVLRVIFAAVAAHGGSETARTTLEAWIQGSGYGSYFGDQILEDGTIPAARVAEAASRISQRKGKASRIQILHQALHELAAFALFAATTVLPRDEELELSVDVNRRLEKIRI